GCGAAIANELATTFGSRDWTRNSSARRTEAVKRRAPLAWTRRVSVWLLAWLVVGGIGTLSRPFQSWAGEASSPSAWHAVETANFRIWTYGTAGIRSQTALDCETLRTDLVTRWLEDDAQDT